MDLVDGPPANIPKDQEEHKDTKDEENSQDEASSKTPMESELDKLQEEVQMKRRFEQGERSRTAGLFDYQVNKVLETITTKTDEN